MTTTKKVTAAEVQKLLTMARNGLGRTEIAFALNRSIASVQVKAFWLNVSVRRAWRAPAMRPSRLQHQKHRLANRDVAHLSAPSLHELLFDVLIHGIGEATLMTKDGIALGQNIFSQ